MGVHGDKHVNNTLSIVPGSSLYSGLDQQTRREAASGHGIVRFVHIFAVTDHCFEVHPHMRDWWNIESYTTTSKGEKFISSMTAKKYPILGVQYHPEKNLENWDPSHD